MQQGTAPEDTYAKAIAEREKYLRRILTSQSAKKLVVAGPGTGKTHLFKEILRNRPKSLTLTFINALVEDLCLELGGISEVRTLHSFAKYLLGELSKKEIRIFPKLAQVIEEDAKILLSKDVNFNEIFHNRDDTNEHIDFYRKRKKYYDDFYGHSDVIFALVICLEKRRDKIPAYEQIVVDEFQDFNQLEVSLIDLLCEKSPVLLAGDDDQALYGFKHASSEHIRRRRHDKTLGYEAFELPFCSRCTRVIVEAANDIIENATKNGYLHGRITKPYRYFEDREKDVVSASHPKIDYSQIKARQIPWFIGKQIERIAKQVRKAFSVLVISPFGKQSLQIASALKEKGFKNVEHADKHDGEPTLPDGLKLLSEERESNLGWRIVAKFLLNKEDFEPLLKETVKDGTHGIHKLVSAELKVRVEEMINVLKRLKKFKPINEDHLRILQGMNVDLLEVVGAALTDELDLAPPAKGDPGVRKIHIKATTIQSSKGLSADYVFITHFDDRFFIGTERNMLTDRQICNFLVALSRARNKVFLISSTGEDPTFLKWIDPQRIERTH
jgi:superfamily I DNA/RNA helicase